MQAAIQLEAMREQAANPYAEDEARWSSLMASAQSGDGIAYRQLLDELSTLVERYLRSRLGSHEFLEDCVQEVLLAVHQARHTYDQRRAFRPWLSDISFKSQPAVCDVFQLRGGAAPAPCAIRRRRAGTRCSSRASTSAGVSGRAGRKVPKVPSRW